MKLIIASNNAHKIDEIRRILGDDFDEILSLRDAGIEHETVEDGKTFAENAEKKAREIADISGCAALADDSGLCVCALNDAPGIFSARYAGEHGDDEANKALLLKNMQAITDRRAYYVCSVALVFPDGRKLTTEARFWGVIADAPRGTGGFGYDPLFVPDGSDRTLAEYTPEEKNAVSHRFLAMRELAGMLRK